jgi:hypothetical protein
MAYITDIALSLIVSLTLVGGSFAADGENSICPSRPNGFVESVLVYDGPTAEMAILRPDEANKTMGLWSLAHIYEVGRIVNIRCRYSDKSSVDISLNKKVAQCRSGIAKNGGLTLSCK